MTVGTDLVPAISGDDKQKAVEAVAEVFDQLGFVKKLVPDLLPNLQEYLDGGKLYALLDRFQAEGMVHTTLDALDALRMALLELVSLVATNRLGQQLQRIAPKASGTLSNSDSQTLRNLTESVFKLTKILETIGSAAGFSTRARFEMGSGGEDGFGKMLKRIMENEGVKAEEDTSGFFGTIKAAKTEPDADQIEAEFVDMPHTRPLTGEELAELLEEKAGVQDTGVEIISREAGGE